MKDILKNTKESTNEVIIKPNREFSQGGTIKFPSEINGQEFPCDEHYLLGSVGGKGLATQVIDLTYSDDENKEPKPANRQFIRKNNGVPFTDSGYASLSNQGRSQNISPSPKKAQHPAKIGRSIVMEDIVREDAKTGFSAQYPKIDSKSQRNGTSRSARRPA